MTELAENKARLVAREAFQTPGYVVLASVVLAYLSWQAFHWLPLEKTLAGDLLLVPMVLAAVYLAWRASRWAADSPGMCRAWRWITLALAAQALGVVGRLASEAVFENPTYPSISDVFQLGSYPLMLVGVLSIPAIRRTRRQTLELLFDCAIVSVGGSALFVYFVLGPELVAAGSALEALVTIAYPAGDLILLGLGAAALRTSLPEVRPSVRWLVIAIGVLFVGDLIAGYAAMHGDYQGGDPIDAVYFLAFACFVVAAVRQRVGPGPGGPAPRTHEAYDSWLPYIAVAACLSILISEEPGQQALHHLDASMMVALVTALVVARQTISLSALRQSQARLTEAQELSHLGSWEWDVARDRFDVSREEARILGIEDSRLLSWERWMRIVHADDRVPVEQMVNAALTSGQSFMFDFRIVRPNGEIRTLQARGEIETRDGHEVRVRGTHQDVTDRQGAEIELQHQVDRDPLTGLYNRRRFSMELDRALRYQSGDSHLGAVLMLDVDNFKLINDAHGHASGDAMLKTVAKAISARARETDVLARISGDEFAIVLPEADEQEALEVAEGIRVAVAEANATGVSRLSVGIAPFDGRRDLVADDLLVAADTALYEAKERGKDQVRFYSGKTDAALTWVERIRTALAEQRFVLYAQPMIDLESGSTTHCELLIRMLDEDGDVIPPGAFLPIAERFGLSNEIDRWVTREGLELARHGDRVSINLSTSSIGDQEILAAVRTAILAGVAPDQLVFEITETAAMTNMDAARSFTEALGDFGCSAALDDFGTGFGSFTYLKHLPTRFLKIDMEFVHDMATNSTDRKVVKSVTEMAHSLGKLIVAEGVEDQVTLGLLREYGVDWAQGFFIGRPRRISPPTPFERARRPSPLPVRIPSSSSA